MNEKTLNHIKKKRKWTKFLKMTETYYFKASQRFYQHQKEDLPGVSFSTQISRNLPRGYLDITQFHFSSRRKSTQSTTWVIKAFGRGHENHVFVGAGMTGSFASLV